MILEEGIRTANNQGLITTTAGPDICHLLTTGRSAVIRKIMWENNTGAPETLIFGTLDNAAVWVPLLPTIHCLNGFDGELREEELPAVEFRVDRTAGAGTTGDILVQASGINLLVRIELEEFGA